MANGNELREFANQLRSEENLSTSQIQRDPRYIAKQEEIAGQREQQLDEKANIEAKNLFNVVNNIDSENITSSVANEYFDLNNLESKDATTNEYYLTPTGEKRYQGLKPKYESDEEYDDYLKSFYRDRYDEYILFQDKNELVKNEQTDSLTDKYKFEQKNKNIEQYLRSVDEDVRNKIDIEY